MRKFIGFLIISFLLVYGVTANADSTWVPGNVGVWSDSANWTGTTPPANPSTETINIADGTATLDGDWQVGILRMDGTASKTGTLNISGYNLTVYKSGTTELIRVAGTNGGTGIINHSAGTVRVYNGAGTGELRLSNAAGATGIYNLSGSAILDVEVLSKGDRTRPGVFNATGGTLVVRNMIYKFGVTEPNGFKLGQATLELGNFNTVSAVNFGNSSNAQDFTAGTGSTMVFDIASATSFDTILQYGNIASTLGNLQIRLLNGFTPEQNSIFDVWTFNDKSKAGSGSFASITNGWSAQWVDTNGDASTDTLRLTYIPEPATIALFGFGLLALRRNRK